MLVLLAALLAADVDNVEATVRAVASSRMEGRAEVSARAASDGISLTIGASESAGASAVQRQELFAAVEADAFRAEARIVPQLGGLFRLAAQAGVHFDSWGLVLDGRTASLGATQLHALGVRLELETAFADDLHAGLSGAAWALQLDAPPLADPWSRYGSATLDWAQRWETGAWASFDIGALSLAPSLSLSRPPQDTFEAHAALAIEAQAGPAKLRVEAGAGRLFAQQLTLVDVSAGITLSLR